MTTPRPGSRAEQRRRTEARILGAATEVFFSARYDRTTIRAVASAAGMAAGLVMHYFMSKRELYRRVIDAPSLRSAGRVRRQPGRSSPGSPARWRASRCVADHLALDVDQSRGRQRCHYPLPSADRPGYPRRRRGPASRDHQRHHVRHHGLPAPIKSDELASADPAQVSGCRDVLLSDRAGVLRQGALTGLTAALGSPEAPCAGVPPQPIQASRRFLRRRRGRRSLSSR
jgi:AcrR family transcriptional regulator